MKKVNKDNKKEEKIVDKWAGYGCAAGIVIGCIIWAITKEYMYLAYSVSACIVIGIIIGAIIGNNQAKK